MLNNPTGTLRILKSKKCDGAPVIFRSPPHARKPKSATAVVLEFQGKGNLTTYWLIENNKN